METQALVLGPTRELAQQIEKVWLLPSSFSLLPPALCLTRCVPV